MVNISNGMIQVLDAEGNTLNGFQINSLAVWLCEDIPDVIGILRCCEVKLETNAPNQVEGEARTMIFNYLADREYNAAGEDAVYKEEAKKDIWSFTGINSSRIKILVRR